MKKSIIRFASAALAGFAVIRSVSVAAGDPAPTAPASPDKVLFAAGPATQWAKMRGKLEIGPDGSLKIQSPSKIQLRAAEEFAVPAGKRLLILGEIRVTGAEPGSKKKPYIGIAGRTAAGRAIDSIAARRISPIFGETTAAVKATDTSVVLKGDLEKWGKFIRRAPHYYLAFGVKADQSDLPNFDFSRSAIKVDGFTRLENGTWKCDFVRTVGRDIPAGTAVGLHYIGSSYPYAVVPPCEGEWKQLYGTFSADGAGGSIRLFPGTAKAGLIIFFDAKGTVEIRNLAIIVE